MSPAVDAVKAVAANISVSAAKVSVISNKDGAVITDGREILDRIVAQISNPVRWDLCMATLEKVGVTGAIEVPPAGTLVGLIKRAIPTVEGFALKSPDDVQGAKDFAATHGAK
jgi:[acyl-carrier-protein] S-malonyltransferase